MYSRTHLCRTNLLTRIRSAVRSRTSKGHSKKIEPEQLVKIWHRDGQSKLTKRMMSLDSATNNNLILRSIVEELDLQVTRSATIRMEGLGDGRVELSELVQPKWQFEKGSSRHQEVNFFVVTKIPGEFDMLLGSITCERLGISLRISSGYALVAHPDHEGLFWLFLPNVSSLVAEASGCTDQSTLDKHQQQYGRQHRDGNADEAKIRQRVAARHREQLRQREAANAANKTKPQASNSQENATSSDDKHG